MNKIYNINLQTPIGLKSGVLNLIINNTVVNGSIKSNSINSSFTDGKFINGILEFRGELNTLFTKTKYDVKGIIKNNTISGIAYTRYGNLPFKGRQVK